jgi:hypothetical protein
VPAAFAAVGVGLTMMGLTSFYVGLAISTICYVVLTFAIHVSLPPNGRAFVGIGAIVLYFIFLNFILIDAPFKVIIMSEEGNYSTGEEVYGIKWEP